MADRTKKPKPKAAIRRFDVFAEYNRQKAIGEGTPSDEAKGYSLWLAKVVAARRGRRPAETRKDRRKTGRPDGARERTGRKWRTLAGKPQTDELFDREIVNRMGRDFYSKVFSPAIRKAIRQGENYVAIRDSIRQDWKP